MDENNDNYNIEYEELITETDKAWLLRIDGKKIWVPKSQCILNEDDREVMMPEWLAMDKEII